MFQLLQPLWLLAISGIAIPVVIHLWNNRKGKTLQVGSILLLQESATQQARSLRLTDILLLILRCLLIILLAFLLAKPLWKKQLTSINEKGWIMAEKQGLQETYKNFKPTIDSLLSVGYKFHYFNRGFKAGKFEDALKAPVDSASVNEFSYWTLLKQLNEQVPAELPVYLFSNDQLKRFDGTRPVISMNLKWDTYTPADTIGKALAGAYETADDSIHIMNADSRPSATIYTSENIPANGSTQYKLTSDNNRTFITSVSNIADKVEVDTATIDVMIYTDQFPADANYVKAAINAVQQYTDRKINVTVINDPPGINQSADWLFWLSEKPVPVQSLPPVVFAYEKGKEQQINSWIMTGDNPVNQEPVSLSRRIQTTAPGNFEAIWTDGFGNALLALDETNNAYHFYSRFNPGWNDLAWSPQFVEMIFDLLFKPDESIKEFDKRTIDAAQLQPVILKESKAFDKEKFVETTDLSKFFWLLAFIVFCIERYLSLKTRKQDSYA